jgi:hypothetical protein
MKRRDSSPCSQSPVLSQTNPVQALPSYFLKIFLILLSPLCSRLSSGFFSLGLPTKTLYARPFSSEGATTPPPPHLVLLDIITLIIFGDKYAMKFLIMQFSSLHLLPPLHAQMSSSSSYSRVLSACIISLLWDTRFHTHKKPQKKLLFCIF